MDESIKRALEEAAKVQTESTTKRTTIETLLKEFPDLKIKTDRWRNQRYSSKSINAIADQVDFRHNCGCCNDSPLEARPFIETMGVRIFADPDCYQVGERDWRGGDSAYPGWKDGLTKNGISEKAIEHIASYLKAVAPDDEDNDLENDE